MKLGEVIDKVNGQRQNRFDQKEKIRWLSQLEWRVKLRILDLYEGAEEINFHGYDVDTDKETVLLVPPPFDDLYCRYLEAQMEYADQQEDRYNNAIALFDELWKDFATWYQSTHTAIRRRLKF